MVLGARGQSICHVPKAGIRYSFAGPSLIMKRELFVSSDLWEEQNGRLLVRCLLVAVPLSFGLWEAHHLCRRSFQKDKDSLFLILLKNMPSQVSPMILLNKSQRPSCILDLWEGGWNQRQESGFRASVW